MNYHFIVAKEFVESRHYQKSDEKLGESDNNDNIIALSAFYKENKLDKNL